ncbi:hypothetical protein [Sinirhodobacter huangdaonensis]|uniref:hypothetical protein n=1 Tax=Paenirhodobacter huangdaonensis TaxID=2501515 RepID=UPI0013E2EEF8|nr:hypothetical protein [Sinirhodobacter huangdaonensis]
MSYIIEYSESGRVVGSTPWSASLDDTKKVASSGLICHSADTAKIIEDTTRKVVATVTK